MATYRAVTAKAEGRSIRVGFEGANGDIGWQLIDPSTGALLYEGDGRVVTLPDEDGPYRVQVSSLRDRGQFIAIDAIVGGGAVQIGAPHVVSASGESWGRMLRAIPKAFAMPCASLWNNRKLIRSMVQRDILARYRGSFGGALWTFLTPLLLMATYFFVFGVVLKTRFSADSSTSGYVFYFLAGMLPWLAFSESVGRSPTIILEYRTFVKKLVFPLDTLPMNLVLSGLVTEAFGVAIFVCGLLVARDGVPGSIVWLPVLLVPQILLTVGIGWILAATGAFVRDLGQVIGFLLTLWFFLTPICYEERSDLPAWISGILAFNPLLVLVRGYRQVLLQNVSPWNAGLGWLWVGSAAVAILGYAWFHRLRKSFADVV
jgi:lipopolysaccharide transport system permease protein